MCPYTTKSSLKLQATAAEIIYFADASLHVVTSLSDHNSEALRHVTGWDRCLVIYSRGRSNSVPDVDNASHAASRTALLLHTALSDFRWDWTLTFIHNVFVFLGAAVKRGGGGGERTRI